jgi:curved DNA-binding protein CbpA
MVDGATQLPEPTAQGTLAKTPLPHLLVYCHERQLSGTIQLSGPNGEGASILVIDGQPTKARTSEPVAYLGRVLLELGMITDSQLDGSLHKLAEEKRLHGQILIEGGLINEEQLELGLRAQLVRKMQHIVRMPPETTFSYYDGFDGLHAYGGDGHIGIDPFPIIWAAIREEPPWEHVHLALTKLAAAGLCIGPEAETARFAFEKGERATIDLLRARALRMHELMAAGTLQPRLVQLLVYCLLITKQLELVSESKLPPPVMPPAPTPPDPDDDEPPPSPLRPVARVTLAQKGITKGRAAVEEGQTPIFPHDERRTPPPTSAPVGPDVRGSYAAASPRTAKTELQPATRDGPSSTPQAVSSPRATKPSASTSVSRPSSPTGPPSRSLGPVSAPTPSLPPDLARRRAEIAERSAIIDKQNYFEMLGLTRESTADQAQHAFFALAKVWHPDRVPAALADVREHCSRVFAHMSEAHQTLTDTQRRQRYLTLLREGGATPESQAEIVAVIEAATNFQKAEICLKRNDLAQAEELCKLAVEGDSQQADYHALLAWLESMKPEMQSGPKTAGLIAKLDIALSLNKNCERAYFYRGMLHKRMQHEALAARDFKRASDLNPRNIDAQREIRLFEMRRGQTSAPPSGKGSAKPTKGKGDDGGKGGLFGKLFKK